MRRSADVSFLRYVGVALTLMVLAAGAVMANGVSQLTSAPPQLIAGVEPERNHSME